MLRAAARDRCVCVQVTGVGRGGGNGGDGGDAGNTDLYVQSQP